VAFMGLLEPLSNPSAGEGPGSPGSHSHSSWTGAWSYPCARPRAMWVPVVLGRRSGSRWSTQLGDVPLFALVEAVSPVESSPEAAP